jgi:hypothetical protein
MMTVQSSDLNRSERSCGGICMLTIGRVVILTIRFDRMIKNELLKSR